MRKLLLLPILGAMLIPSTAYASHNDPKFPDPCPGKHVQVYNDAGGNNYPEVGGHFVCGPVKGDKGDKGDQGAPGANCYDGLEIESPSVEDCRGPQGEQGEQGEQGIQGIQGKPGNDGSNGADGEPGSPGSDGAPGEPGPAGTNGTNGSNGTNANEEELRALITELNNRLFILEHTDAPSQPDTTGETPSPTTPTELPHTGAGTTIVLLVLGAGLVLLGLLARFLKKDAVEG